MTPTIPLIVMALKQPSVHPVWTRPFVEAVWQTLCLGFGVSLLALLVGFPAGLLAALYHAPGRSWLLPIQALPLLLPSFLLCIGWGDLAASGWLAAVPAPNGLIACMLVQGVQMAPLPLLVTWAACHDLRASQIDAARIHGGERLVLKQAALACGPAAMLASLLGGILSLSDPGAPLIFGCRSVAVEIRTSFAALFDFGLAGRQCVAMALIVLLLMTPLLAFGLRRLAAAVLARQMRPVIPLVHGKLRWLALCFLLVLPLVGVALPAIGLCLPALRDPMLQRAAGKVAATAAPTLFFTVGAGLVAVLLATTVALAARTDVRLRLLTLAVLLSLLAMPPALAAIGVSRLATSLPAAWDWLTRGQLVVAFVLGLRFLPVATVTMMRSIGSMPSSWTEAARVHGIAAWRLLARVKLPVLLPAIVISLLLVIVLSAADISTTHSLQPPGKQSLPVAIFTVMANSPEGLVASLCLVDLLCVVACSVAGWQLWRWLQRSVV